MKKLMVCTTLVLLLGANNHADEMPPYDGGPYEYDGFFDDTWWRSPKWYDTCVSPTTLGVLARYSDIIGVGQVSEKQETYFTVKIDLALFGCTNGAVIMVHDGLENEDLFVKSERQNWFPTNNSRIVFAAYTNDYGFLKTEIMYRKYPKLPQTPEKILPNPTLRYLNRSWWYVDRDDGILTAQFTNILQAVRVESNWANYFHLCRDGAFSMSDRVKEDSFWDMRDVARYATLAQIPLILADPLVDPKLKDLLNTSGWNNPNLEAP